MVKQSAGILIYKAVGDTVEVLLGHPGGPFWAKKDDGAWSIPKGEVEDGEDLQTAARREFTEEMGSPPPDGKLVSLGKVKISSGKVIHIWALEADFDEKKLQSNSFEMVWPPKSDNLQSFPEIDRAAWYPLGVALSKTHTGQSVFIERLAERLGVDLSRATDQKTGPPEQIGLF